MWGACWLSVWLFVCLGVYMWVNLCYGTYVEIRRQTLEISSLLPCRSQGLTNIVRFDDQHLYLLNHLASSSVFLVEILCLVGAISLHLVGDFSEEERQKQEEVRR